MIESGVINNYLSKYQIKKPEVCRHYVNLETDLSMLTGMSGNWAGRSGNQKYAGNLYAIGRSLWYRNLLILSGAFPQVRSKLVTEKII